MSFHVERLPIEARTGSEPPHDISAGMKRHFPIEYARIGSQRKKSLWPGVAFVAALVAIGYWLSLAA